MSQDASDRQPSTVSLHCFGGEYDDPADVLENVKAVVTFLNGAVCNALSGRSGHLTGEGILGVNLIFGAVVSSLDAVSKTIRNTRDH
ncbi:hypothetical protein M2352_002318 [Azospirillum fermentarium]|uniref:hypothetical protein n=1 Tax=Azospirillum fermentarium TaxID=1233114 RepID=UPI00222790DE|nr:hypothetical protein [Azospirillum fermentarium]MCW2246727.1 hypothetical protein [Azospirillum fermentarium]